jgi:hypothetical protein
MALDDTDKKTVGELIAAALKDALRPEALGAVLAPVVKAHTDAALKGTVTSDALKTQLDELAAKLKPADPDPADKGADKGKKPDDDPRIAAMQKRMAEIEAASAAKDRALADEKARARTEALHLAARDGLAKAGVPSDRLAPALAYVRSLGVLDYDGDTPGWKGKNSLGLDAVLPMEDAAASWVKSDGKLFLPPSGAGGTGDGAGNRDSQRTGPPSAIRNGDGSLNVQALASRIAAAT